jgi:hypothetical protein
MAQACYPTSVPVYPPTSTYGAGGWDQGLWTTSTSYYGTGSTATIDATLSVKGPTSYQGAIIALSVLCGLLFLILVLLIICLACCHKRQHKDTSRLDIEGTSAGRAHHRRRRRQRSEKSDVEYEPEPPRVAPPGMNPAFFRPGPRPVWPSSHYFPNRRMQQGGGINREIISKVEEGSVTSTTGATGSRTESERRRDESRPDGRGRMRGK